MARRDPEAHERMLAGIVERAAINGKGLGVAMPPGEVGGRFDVEAPPPAEKTAEELTEQTIALDALVHKIAAALAGADMDLAITSLISLAVAYAKAEETPQELRVATAQRLLMAVEAVSEAYEQEIARGIQAVSEAGWVPMKLQSEGEGE